jgi:tetratricopeptide (TPR) repeat protein
MTSNKAAPPVEMTKKEIDRKVEEMFDRADDLMISQKNFGEAKEIYNEILKLDPMNIDGLNSLAQCIKATATSNIFSQVFPLYQKALSVDPEDFETNFNMGVLYYEQKKDYAQAINFLKVAQSEEANPSTLFNLGVIYEEQGKHIDALKAY